MRKCVSMVAVASAAFGVAACSGPDRPGEPAGAARPLSAQAAAPAAAGDRAHPAPVAVAQAAAKAPAAPASGAVPTQPGQAARPAAAGSPVGTPVLIPSGTSDLAPQGTHSHPATVRAAAAAAAAGTVVPAEPRPGPPPPAAQDRDAQSAVGDTMAAAAQIMNAMAASRADGKSVLLDFGASWCTACRAMDKAMRTPRVQAILAQSYHVVHIDLGNADPQHLALATQYDPMGTFGMPLLVVLNPDGTVRADSAHVGQPKYDEAGVAAWLSQWGPR